MLQTLQLTVAQLKAEKTSENFLNEIHQIIHSLSK